MTILDMRRSDSFGARRRAERREYGLIFALIYVPLLVTAIGSRIVWLVTRRHGQAGPKRSVFSEARIAAASCVPFAFR